MGREWKEKGKGREGKGKREGKWEVKEKRRGECFNVPAGKVELSTNG